MKKLSFLVIAIFSLLLLASCSGDKQEETKGNKEGEVVETNKPVDGNEKNKDSGGNSKNNEKKDNNKNKGGNTNTEFPADQDNLKIGDTAEIKTTVNHFEATIKSVKIAEKFNDHTPNDEQFILIDVLLKNLSDEELPLSEASGYFKVYESIERSGTSEISTALGSNHFNGNLKPGETMEGTLVFDYRKLDEYLLVAGGTLSDLNMMNRAIWKFTNEEI